MIKENKKIILSTLCLTKIYKKSPTALYSLKAYFEKYTRHKSSGINIDIDVFTASAKTTGILKNITGKKPDIIGFSCYIYNITKILRLASIIKKSNPNIKIILGGPEVSPEAEDYLKKSKAVDIIVRGEGEETFRELADALLGGNPDLSKVKGISYRQEGEIFSNPDRPLIDDLNKIPSPYLEGMVNLDGAHYACLEDMRGCPYKCHYCYYGKNSYILRFFSLERVAEELKFILARETPYVEIVGATFNANRPRAKEIIKIFLKYNKNSQLRVEIKAELLDREMIRLFDKADMRNIEIGLQSINPQGLKLSNRTLQRSIFKKNVRLLIRHKIYPNVHLISGLPGDTYQDIMSAINWLYYSFPRIFLAVFRLKVLPGTYFRTHAKELGLIYRHRPPYKLYKNRTITHGELDEIENLSPIINMFFHQMFLRDTVCALKKKGSIYISDILVDWLKWSKRNIFSRDKSSRSPFRVNKVEYELLKSNILKNTPAFFRYICNKYKKPWLYKEIFPILKRDLAKFYFKCH
jgi:radical SAM superfamily enzyme YgiQ (UPF0313 family)